MGLAVEPQKIQKLNKSAEIKKYSRDYETAYFLILNSLPKWKKEVVQNDDGGEDRVVDEFLREVINLAERK